MTSIVAGQLVLHDEVVGGRLRIEDGRIAAVEHDDAEVGGPFIAPGFVDIHVHGFGGHDAMAGPTALDGMARALLRRGVTSFLPTAVTAGLDTLADFVASVRAWRASAPADGAAPLGVNLEGPFISPARAGAQNPASIRSPAGLDLEAVLGPLLGELRVMTVAPEIDGAVPLIAWLASRGVAASLGHSDATLDQARAGYAAGARTTTHLFNAMSGASHRAPGLAVAALENDEAFVELIADGLHVDPALWPLVVRTKPADRLVLVSDALAPAGAGDGGALVGGLAVELRGSRLTLAGTETLAGSTIALDEAVVNLVSAGTSLPLASRAASANPLALLGVTDRGRLAVGQLADLVELDNDLRVTRAARAGEWHSRA